VKFVQRGSAAGTVWGIARWLAGAVLIQLLAPAALASTACSGSGNTVVLGTYTGQLLTSGVSNGTLSCPSGSSYTIALGAGTGTGATVSTRALTGPSSSQLKYSLFQDSARTINWGNTPGVDTENGTGSGSSKPITIYPSVPAGQYVRPGSYVDSVLLTLTGSGLTTTSYYVSVTATVQPTCTISANPLSFGTYTGAVASAVTVVSVTCTSTTPYNVGLSAGNGTGATVTTRQMKGVSPAVLAYGLFTNTTHTTNWGNTVGTDTVAGTGTGAAQGLYVYGQIPAGQNVAPGSYSDVIVATLTY
jgi:spore coat protein U-like protein